jgi:SOS response regulatory protein OraA/RecX
MDSLNKKISVEELREILNEPSMPLDEAELIIDSLYQLSWIAIDSIND